MAISEGLRKEVNGKIKVIVVSPALTEIELGQDITDEAIAAIL